MTVSSKTQVFMDGTNEPKSYLKIGQKGNMAVGLKVLPLIPGEMFNQPDKILLVCRIRVAPRQNLPPKSQNYAMPKDAFPDVSWNKSDKNRASTLLHVAIPNYQQTVEAFIADIETNLSEKIYSQITDHLKDDCLEQTRQITLCYIQERLDNIKQELVQAIGEAQETEIDGTLLDFMGASIAAALKNKNKPPKTKPTIH